MEVVGCEEWEGGEH